MPRLFLQVEHHDHILEVLRYHVHHIWRIIAGLPNADNDVIHRRVTNETISSSSARGSLRACGEKYALAMLHRKRSVAQLVRKRTTVRKTTLRMRSNEKKLSHRW